MPLGLLKPNCWGLSGISGNVDEHCWDSYDGNTYLDRIAEGGIAVDPFFRNKRGTLARGQGFVSDRGGIGANQNFNGSDGVNGEYSEQWGFVDGAMSRFKIENKVVQSARGADRRGDDFKVRYCSHLAFDFLSHLTGGFVAFSIP